MVQLYSNKWRIAMQADFATDQVKYEEGTYMLQPILEPSFTR